MGSYLIGFIICFYIIFGWVIWNTIPIKKITSFGKIILFIITLPTLILVLAMCLFYILFVKNGKEKAKEILNILWNGEINGK